MKKNLEYFLKKVFKNTSVNCSIQIINHLKSKKRKAKFLSTLNTNSLLILDKDEKFKDALASSNWIIPDGYGAILACRILGIKISERIAGTDIFNELNFKLNKEKKYKYLFFGSTNKTLRFIVNKMKLDYPNIKVLGYLSPPFKKTYSKIENRKMLSFINKKKPDVLWVGLTQPKQEKWIYENINKLDSKFIGAIGAVFDFYSGQIKRAPKIVQDLGFEWLYRILQDPKRLWKRYLLCNLNLFFKVIPYLISLKIKLLLNL
tara:strand:- start:1248 stop:2030 length:783 start_codon:yes stop_codon:yes gene_type:complete